ncbi:hypothetical protein KVT40_007505 [Elsinoe batatas]|uniref:Uncharacterized protein n=1 Tax=Elsinoe batatas TaxID=2601811 RepID=A0A8K0KXI9_9PEZI|nr:hypothetical protein KVT40_007505 [Elsinoe batatas]
MATRKDAETQDERWQRERVETALKEISHPWQNHSCKANPLTRSDQSVFADFEEALAKMKKGPRPDASKLAGVPSTFVHQEPNHSTSSPAVRTDPFPSAASYRPSPPASLSTGPNISFKPLQPVPFTQGEYAFVTSQRDSSSDFVVDIGYPHNVDPPSPDLDVLQGPGGEHGSFEFFTAPADFGCQWYYRHQATDAASLEGLSLPASTGEEILTIGEHPSPTKDVDMEDADQWVHVNPSDVAPTVSASTTHNAPAVTITGATSATSRGPIKSGESTSRNKEADRIPFRPAPRDLKDHEVAQKATEQAEAGTGVVAIAPTRLHGGTVAERGKAVLLGSVEAGMDCDIVDSLGRTVDVELASSPCWILPAGFSTNISRS